MKKTLILGRGYIGTELFSKIENSICVNKSELDYTDNSILQNYILQNNITNLINCVGFTGRPNIDEAENKKEDCWFYNVKLPLMFSNVAKNLNINYIQISSGCIYTGYEKEWSELDKPNFGMFDQSSFYSKSKHAFELLNDYGLNIRIRMPFGDELVDRNYIKKILNYDNLINFKNSKTYICDLSRFINHIILSEKDINIGNLNFVNPNPLDTSEVLDIMKEFGLTNSNWKFVDISEIPILAPRSNCVLSTDKLRSIFPDFELNSENIVLKKSIANYRN